MTEAKRQKYTKELKQDAVRLVTEQGYTIAKAARNLGINDNLIGRWKREFDAQGATAFPGQGRQTPEQEELKRLREENRQLKLEREILKKATVNSTGRRNTCLKSIGWRSESQGLSWALIQA